MKKVSILVPIYNVEKFLPECLDSLINQTLKDIEIICINDGSKDGSLEIVKKYAKEDERIRIINKNNTGYGDSMNKGLAMAEGEYIGIVESDDFIDLDAFEKMYQTAIENDAEVVKSNFYEYFGETGIDKRTSAMFKPNEINRVINPRKNPNIFYQPPCIWAAIYKRDFLIENSIDFIPSPGASYQDTGFNFKVWASVKRAFFIEQPFLHYRQDNSNSSVKDSGKIYCVKEEYDSAENYLIDNNIEDLMPILFTCRFGSYIWNLRRLGFKAAMKFSKVVREDYLRAKKAGYLNDDKMDEVGRHNAKMIAIRHPRIYILLRPLHDFRNNLRVVGSKIAKKIFPRYNQRIQAIDKIARLEFAQENLIAKLTKINKEKKENHGKK